MMTNPVVQFLDKKNFVKNFFSPIYYIHLQIGSEHKNDLFHKFWEVWAKNGFKIRTLQSKTRLLSTLLYIFAWKNFFRVSDQVETKILLGGRIFLRKYFFQGKFYKKVLKRRVFDWRVRISNLFFDQTFRN